MSQAGDKKHHGSEEKSGPEVSDRTVWAADGSPCRQITRDTDEQPHRARPVPNASEPPTGYAFQCRLSSHQGADDGGVRRAVTRLIPVLAPGNTRFG